LLFQKIYLSLHPKAQLWSGRARFITSMERDLWPFVGPGSEGRFLNVTCLSESNLANLNLDSEVMQQETSAWAIIYIPASDFPIYINKVYSHLGGYLCIYT
jgi:hypothetical protein